MSFRPPQTDENPYDETPTVVSPRRATPGGASPDTAASRKSGLPKPVLVLLVIFLTLGSLAMLATLAGVGWYFWKLRPQPVATDNAVAPSSLVAEAEPHDP